MRTARLHTCTCLLCQQDQTNADSAHHRAMNLLLSLLSPSQRRLYAAIESVRIGRRGVSMVSEITGLWRPTISLGRKELATLQDGPPIEKPKGRPGRKSTEKKYPGIELVLEQLLADETAGDPMSKKIWVRISSRMISKKLDDLGYRINYRTICRLLAQNGYSLKVNVKKRASTQYSPKRDTQFHYIAEQRSAFLASGKPIISVDCKKKELVGNFRANGQAWCKDAVEVSEHSFASMAECVATPYGIYDLMANAGYVWVGTSRDTPAFAVTAIERWWLLAGRKAYPHTNELLILADSGGSNGFRCRAWKQQLQMRLCDEHGLNVTVCHYPTGCSKYNPIERRLFSHISMNWSGKPLVSLELMLGYIRGTTTQTGLTVQAFHMDETFALGERVSKNALGQLALQPHQKCPDWNYTISPRLGQGGCTTSV